MVVRGQRHAPAALHPAALPPAALHPAALHPAALPPAALPPAALPPVPTVKYGAWAPGAEWAGAANLASSGTRSPDRPARSESLYRLSSVFIA